MLAATRAAIRSQFEAALAMLADAVRQCPAECWTAGVTRMSCWYVAYHTLFYADLYLSRDETGFQLPAYARNDDMTQGESGWSGPPPDPADLLRHIDMILEKLHRMLDAETEETLAEPSGFPWMNKRINRLELYLYNIRHIQHHTGQLSAHLRTKADIGVRWVGRDYSK